MRWLSGSCEMVCTRCMPNRKRQVEILEPCPNPCITHNLSAARRPREIHLLFLIHFYLIRDEKKEDFLFINKRFVCSHMVDSVPSVRTHADAFTLQRCVSISLMPCFPCTRNTRKNQYQTEMQSNAVKIKSEFLFFAKSFLFHL